jgi:uncharacterized protein (TIGR02453 family)
MGFAGFPPEALDFFRGLERNNKREWFQKRKDRFETQVKAPMVALVEELNRQLSRLAPDYVVEPQKAIYRIYRDTRFSADKTPYKTHIAAVFKHRSLDKHAGGGLYFSVSHKTIEVAGGVYMPGPEELFEIRMYLAAHHEEFRRILKAKALRERLGELWGQQLSRVPKGFSAGHPAADLLRYKQWLVYKDNIGPEIATTPAFLPDLTRRFRAMMPFVEFLNRPLVMRRRSATAGFLG